jgi:transposase
MMKDRKQFTKEFKEGASRLVTGQGRTVADAARSLGLSPWTLSRWVRDARGEGENAFRGQGQHTPQEQEIYELRQQVKQLEEEHAILKKAAAYLAKSMVYSTPSSALTKRGSAWPQCGACMS